MRLRPVSAANRCPSGKNSQNFPWHASNRCDLTGVETERGGYDLRALAEAADQRDLASERLSLSPTGISQQIEASHVDLFAVKGVD